MLSNNILYKQKPSFLGFCFTVLFALAGLCLTACSKSSTDSEEPYAATLKLLMSDDVVSLSAAEGASGRIVFSCDYNWTIEIPEEGSWIMPAKSSGEAGSRITVKIEAAKNEGKARSAVCRIVSGASSVKFTVKQNLATITLSEDQIEDYDRIYKPAEFKFDRKRSDSEWSFCRSKQSEHFIVFWGIEYGEHGLFGDEPSSPSTLAPSHAMYVDIDDLLMKAEMFYDVNVNKLKFADVEGGKSNFCDYKIGIYLTYTTEWMAYGGGYDNFIGALWINPATCKPVGSTIAHEIGHSFQYQVYADQVRNGAPDDLSTGWRYEIGQGTGFWEQCAQWQSYQSYAEQAFSTVNFTEFVNNCHRHFLHEHQRYASYFLQWYWAEKHGVEVLGELWRESKKPEDPIETYMRKFGLSVEELNRELYDYAAKCTTWDFDVEATNLFEGQATGITKPVRDFGKEYIGKIGWNASCDPETHVYTVSPDRAPEATGFNHIRLNLPAAGTTVTTEFEGLPNAAGFNPVADASKAGWHCGYVALLADGQRVYSDPVWVVQTASVPFTVPENCSKLWFVVAATPVSYMTHLWDEDNTNDEVWPFSLRFSGTDLYGNITFDGSETPHDTTISHDIELSASAGYSGPSYTLEGEDLIAIASAFVLQPTDIISKLPADRANVSKGEVKFAAVEPDGSLSYNFTANGYGHWFGADGSVQGWSSAYFYSEFAPSTWSFQFGCHPSRVEAGELKIGDRYTLRQALVYGQYRAVLEFHITVVE